MNNKLNLKQSLTAGLLAAVASSTINVVLFFLFKALGVITEDIFVEPGKPLTVLPVIISSIIPTMLAVLVFFLFEKFTNNGFRIFSIVTVILTLLSLAGPSFIPGVTIGYQIALDIMHIVVPSLLLFFISRARKAVN